LITTRQHKIIEDLNELLIKHDKRREDLPGYVKKIPSDSTVRTYESTYLSLMKKAENEQRNLISVALDTTSTNTWFKRRAALIYQFKKQIGFLTDEIKLNHDLLYSDECLTELENLATLLSTIETTKLELPKKKKAKSKSKKSQLSLLPKGMDWRLKIFERMPNYREQIATLILTGCRPAELVIGVVWTIEGESLIATIKGVKIGLYSGQEERIITFDKSNAMANAMYQFVKQKGGAHTVSTASAINLTTAIRSAGRRAFPAYKHSITCYSFRHQLGADLKASGTNGDDISRMLGHASARTKAYYGVRRQGSIGGVDHIKSVVASREIKPLSNFTHVFFNRHEISHPDMHQKASVIYTNMSIPKVR
jgi:integrase